MEGTLHHPAAQSDSIVNADIKVEEELKIWKAREQRRDWVVGHCTRPCCRFTHALQPESRIKLTTRSCLLPRRPMRLVMPRMELRRTKPLRSRITTKRLGQPLTFNLVDVV